QVKPKNRLQQESSRQRYGRCCNASCSVVSLPIKKWKWKLVALGIARNSTVKPYHFQQFPELPYVISGLLPEVT
ncbi:UNVERIFIED_CONTAM: hypothetical protein K2H54_022208, partial [Gekko kuhli]